LSKENCKTILLVEDEAVTMMLESKQLSENGYYVVQALDGDEAVVKVRTHPGAIDLILMDIDLGQGIDGTEAAEIILKDHDIPIIFVSAHMERDIVEKTEKISSYGYVLKNSSEAILMASIRMAFRLHEAHRQIWESEERYRSIVENVPLGMFQSTPEGKFLYANRALAELLNYESSLDLIDTVNRTSIAEAIYEDPARRPVLVEEVSQSGGSWKTYENRYRRKDGIIIDALLTFGEKIDMLTGQTYLLGFVRDITENKNMERDTISDQKRLLESNQLMSGILFYTHVMAVYLDSRFNFIWVNKSYAETCGQEPSFFSGKNHFDLYPDEENRAIFQRVVDTGEPFYIEAKPFVFPDQPMRGMTYWDWSLIPVRDGEGRVTGLVFTLVEVTERVKVQKQRELNESRIVALLELSRMDSASIKEIADFVLDKIVSLTGSTIGFLGIIDEDEKEMTVHAWSEQAMAACEIKDKPLYFNIAESGIWAEAVRKREVVYINDYAVPAPGKKGLPGGHVRLDRLISVPVAVGGRVAAIAAVGNKPEEYNDADARLITLLVDGMIKAGDRMESESRLRRSEEKYRTVADYTHDWEYWAGPDGEFIYVSPSFETVTGYALGAFTGVVSLMTSIVHPEDMSFVMDHVKSALNEDHHKDEETIDFRIIHKSGTIVWIGHRCQPVFGQDGQWLGVRGSNRDISGRKHANDERESADRHLEAVLSALPDTMFELDMDRRFLAYHARETNNLYLQPHEFIGKKIDEVIPPDIIPLLDEMFREILEKGSHSGVAYKLNMPKGETWYELSASLMGDPSSTAARFIVLTRDITERKRNEKALSGALEENRALLRELQHRVKNSLTMIGSLTILEGARSGNPAVEAAMKNLEGRIRILSDLYSMLYESGNVREIRADIYLGRLCGSVMKVYGKHTGITMILDEVTMNVKKASVLGLILNELLTNAIKHARGGMEDGLIEVALHVRGDRVELSVADNGPGLPEDFSVQKEGALGLKLVDMMARQLKGALTCESGEKTIFTIGFSIDGRLT